MRRRRWLQFSLSSIFLLVTVLGVWLGIVVNEARKQREAVAAIEAAGARWVAYDYQSAPVVPPQKEPPGPRWLRRMLGDEYFQSIYSVNLQNAKISDDLLRHIASQKSIRDLWLGNPEIGDRELAFLSELHHLQWIDFLPAWDAGTADPEGETSLRISAVGLQHFRRLPNLKTLRLSQSPIGDAGLAILGEITTLEELLFKDPQVTDAGLEHLKSLKHLKELSFTAPRATDEGIEQLKGLTNLEQLGVDQGSITDRGFESLRGLAKLRELFLQTNSPGITDAALDNLSGLTELEVIYIICPGDGITDAGLRRLKGLAKLKSVNILSRGITDEGAKEMRQALPSCRFGF